MGVSGICISAWMNAAVVWCVCFGCRLEGLTGCSRGGGGRRRGGSVQVSELLVWSLWAGYSLSSSHYTVFHLCHSSPTDCSSTSPFSQQSDPEPTYSMLLLFPYFLSLLPLEHAHNMLLTPQSFWHFDFTLNYNLHTIYCDSLNTEEKMYGL